MVVRKYWNAILYNVIEDTVSNAQKWEKIDRNIVFILLRNFLIHMMMNCTTADDDDASRMAAIRYGKQTIMNWCIVRNTPQIKSMLSSIERMIAQCILICDAGTNTDTITACVWEQHRSDIIATIINPYLTRRSMIIRSHEVKEEEEASTDTTNSRKRSLISDDITATHQCRQNQTIKKVKFLHDKIIDELQRSHMLSANII